MRKRMIVLGLMIVVVVSFTATTWAGPPFQTCGGKWLPPCPKKIFVTSQTYDGNLEGLSGADAKCQSLANAAHLKGIYKAWLSTVDKSAAVRLNHNAGPYYDTCSPSNMVAENWTILISGVLRYPITCDEKHTPIDPPFASVWTATDSTGQLPPDYGADCYAFNSADGTNVTDTAVVGTVGQRDYRWTGYLTDSILKYDYCNLFNHLICIEQ